MLIHTVGTIGNENNRNHGAKRSRLIHVEQKIGMIYCIKNEFLGYDNPLNSIN
jgi:hypothetical protein